MLSRLRAAPLAACAALLLAATQAQAQRRALDPPRWTGDAAALGINAALGGLTAGVGQWLGGGSFTDGFTRGFAGGALVYGGKRVAVQNFSGAGLLGREVAAVGSSVIRNAAEGRGSLSRLVLPAGPVRLYVETTGGWRVRPRVDGATLVAAAYGVLEDSLRFDLDASFSSGAVVFQVDSLLVRGPGGSETGASGITRAGTIYLSDIVGIDAEIDLRHEVVHVIQQDQIFLTMTDPVENWALRRIPGGAWVSRYLDPNLAWAVTGLLGDVAFKNYANRPWELEARFLAER